MFFLSSECKNVIKVEFGAGFYLVGAKAINALTTGMRDELEKCITKHKELF